MSRVPRQSDVLDSLEREARTVSSNEILMADKLSTQIARAQQGTASAVAAAAAAYQAAATASAAADSATAAAGAASTAALDAYNASILAYSAAEAASQRAATLGFTGMVAATPTTWQPICYTGWTTMPEMALTIDSYGFPLLFIFACDLITDTKAGVYATVCMPGIGQTFRTAKQQGGIDDPPGMRPLSFQFAWAGVPPGLRYYEIQWSRTHESNVWSPGASRSFSAIRLGVP